MSLMTGENIPEHWTGTPHEWDAWTTLHNPTATETQKTRARETIYTHTWPEVERFLIAKARHHHRSGTRGDWTSTAGAAYTELAARFDPTKSPSLKVWILTTGENTIATLTREYAGHSITTHTANTRYRRAEENLWNTLGRQPTHREITAHAETTTTRHIPENTYHHRLADHAGPASIDAYETPTHADAHITTHTPSAETTYFTSHEPTEPADHDAPTTCPTCHLIRTAILLTPHTGNRAHDRARLRELVTAATDVTIHHLGAGPCDCTRCAGPRTGPCHRSETEWARWWVTVNADLTLPLTGGDTPTTMSARAITTLAQRVATTPCDGTTCLATPTTHQKTAA